MDRKKRKKAIIVFSCLLYIGSPLVIFAVNFLEKKGVQMPVMTEAYMQIGMLILFSIWTYLVVICKPIDDKEKKNQSKEKK